MTGRLRDRAGAPSGDSRWRWAVLTTVLVIAVPANLRADAVTDYNLAVEFYKQQRWQSAADACQEFVERYPQHERLASARLYWAQSLVHLRNFAAAREQFQQFLAADGNHPDRPLAMYRLGECAYFLKDYQTAAADLRRYLAEYPDHELGEWALVYLGEVLYRMQDYAGAAESLQQSLQKYPQGSLRDDAEFGLARTYEKLGRNDQAQEMYASIVAKGSSSRLVDAQLKIGGRLFDDRKFEQAAEVFRQAAERAGDSPRGALADLNAGYSYYHLERYDDAIACFERASRNSDQRPFAQFWLGLALKSQKKYAEAAEVFSRSLEAQPDSALTEKLVFHLADAELRQGHGDRARELFADVERRWPQGELADDALHTAAESALQSGELETALSLHEDFISRYPQSGLRQMQDLLAGRLFIALGDAAGATPEATAHYRRALESLEQTLKVSRIDQTRRLARYQLARTLERLKQDADAVAQLDELLASQSIPEEERREVLLMRGNCLLRLDRFADAQRDFLSLDETDLDDVGRRSQLSGLVAAHAGQKDWTAVEETLQRMSGVEGAESEYCRSAIAAGDLAYDAQAFDQAENLFRSAVERPSVGSHALPALSGLAHAHYEQQHFAEAARAFESLEAAAGDDSVLASHAAYMRALSLQQAGEGPPAFEAFQHVIEAFASSPKSEVSLNVYRSAKGGARTARELSQIEEADRLYGVAHDKLEQQSAETQQERDKLIFEWADLSYNAQKYDRSDELYALLLKECPDSPLAGNAKLVLAESLRFGGETGAARMAFQKLLVDPQADDFIQQRALVHLLDMSAEAADWKLVQDAAATLLKKFPTSTHRSYAEYRRGEALLQLQQPGEAAKILENLRAELTKSFETAPDWWPEAWLLLAEARYQLKEYDALASVIDDLKARGPNVKLMYRADVMEGRSLENRARFPEARAAYERVIESDSGRGTETAAEAQFRIAETWLKENNLAAALKEYYKVYAGYEAPRYESAALYQAAVCDVSLKNFSGAAISYRKLLAEFPDSEFTSRAQKGLDALLAEHPELKTETPARD